MSNLLVASQLFGSSVEAQDDQGGRDLGNHLVSLPHFIYVETEAKSGTCLRACLP